MPKLMNMYPFYMLGSMMLGEKVLAYMSGAMIHAGMSVAFALAHVGLYQAFDFDTNLAVWGRVLGNRRNDYGHDAGDAPANKDGSLEAPGAFAINYPMATTMGFLMLHLMFGVLVGVFYDVFGGV